MPRSAPSIHQIGKRQQREAGVRDLPPKQTTTERGYGYAWQQLRKRILRDEPLCRRCKEQGRTTAAQQVHHRDHNTLNTALDNLEPLCKACHAAHHAASPPPSRGVGA